MTDGAVAGGARGMHLAADDVADAAARLTASADAVARAGAALRTVTVSAATAGPRYRAEGARVAAGLAGVDDALADWSRHTVTMARALAQASDGLRGADSDAAAALRGLDGAGRGTGSPGAGRG